MATKIKIVFGYIKQNEF